MTIYMIRHQTYDDSRYFIKADDEQDALRKAERTLRYWSDEEDDDNVDFWYAEYEAVPIEFDDEVWDAAEKSVGKTDAPYLVVKGEELMTAVAHGFPNNWDWFNKYYNLVNGDRDYRN